MGGRGGGRGRTTSRVPMSASFEPNIGCDPTDIERYANLSTVPAVGAEEDVVPLAQFGGVDTMTVSDAEHGSDLDSVVGPGNRLECADSLDSQTPSSTSFSTSTPSASTTSRRSLAAWAAAQDAATQASSHYQLGSLLGDDKPPVWQVEREDIERRLEARLRDCVERSARWRMVVNDSRQALLSSEGLLLDRLSENERRHVTRMEESCTAQCAKRDVAEQRAQLGVLDGVAMEARSNAVRADLQKQQLQRLENQLATIARRQEAAEEAGRYRWLATTATSIGASTTRLSAANAMMTTTASVAAFMRSAEIPCQSVPT